jgi:AcrR family transcriptional regulator
MASRAPGRPRDPSADRAILEATLRLLAEQGYNRLALTEVAKRAGVSTATLYRRWPTKVPLVLDALKTLILTVPLPDTGNTRADLVDFLTERLQTAGSPLLAQVIPALTAEGQRNPALAELFWSIQRPVRQQAFTLFERGIARGDLPPTLDRELALDLLLGPITFRQFISGAPLDSALAPAIVDAVLHGIAQRSLKEL